MVGRVRGYTGIRLPLQTGHYSRYPLGCGGIRTNKKLREWNRTKAKFVSVNHDAGDKSTLSCHVIEDSSLEGGKGPSNLRKTCVVISLLIGSFLRCGVSLLLSVSLVYADKPQTLDHLEDNIRRVIADIRPQVLEKVIENWTSRLDYIRVSPVPEITFKM
ncbi:hypothetical protein TNCV_4969121 [Trichonephila clavipes]|nr:hypothetical protein TNCV_4969121 [Trichonephila clavipes]